MNSQSALLVDDSALARVALKKLLKECGIDAVSVNSGQESISYLKNHQPDIVFMDMMMPELDGIETVKAIQAHAETTKPPILIWSLNVASYANKTDDLNVIGFFQKPTKADEMVALLNHINLNQATDEKVSPLPQSKAKQRPSGHTIDHVHTSEAIINTPQKGKGTKKTTNPIFKQHNKPQKPEPSSVNEPAQKPPLDKTAIKNHRTAQLTPIPKTTEMSVQSNDNNPNESTNGTDKELRNIASLSAANSLAEQTANTVSAQIVGQVSDLVADIVNDLERHITEHAFKAVAEIMARDTFRHELFQLVEGKIIPKIQQDVQDIVSASTDTQQK